jgi:hypothetical protein
VRPGRKPPKDAYGIRLDGERYQLDGQPPVARPQGPWGVPLSEAARANARAFEEAWQEEADALVGE